MSSALLWVFVLVFYSRCSHGIPTARLVKVEPVVDPTVTRQPLTVDDFEGVYNRFLEVSSTGHLCPKTWSIDEKAKEVNTGVVGLPLNTIALDENKCPSDGTLRVQRVKKLYDGIVTDIFKLPRASSGIGKVLRKILLEVEDAYYGVVGETMKCGDVSLFVESSVLFTSDCHTFDRDLRVPFQGCPKIIMIRDSTKTCAYSGHWGTTQNSTGDSVVPAKPSVIATVSGDSPAILPPKPPTLPSIPGTPPDEGTESGTKDPRPSTAAGPDTPPPDNESPMAIPSTNPVPPVAGKPPPMSPGGQNTQVPPTAGSPDRTPRGIPSPVGDILPPIEAPSARPSSSRRPPPPPPRPAQTQGPGIPSAPTGPASSQSPGRPGAEASGSSPGEDVGTGGTRPKPSSSATDNALAVPKDPVLESSTLAPESLPGSAPSPTNQPIVSAPVATPGGAKPEDGVAMPSFMLPRPKPVVNVPEDSTTQTSAPSASVVAPLPDLTVQTMKPNSSSLVSPSNESPLEFLGVPPSLLPSPVPSSSIVPSSPILAPSTSTSGEMNGSTPSSTAVDLFSKPGLGTNGSSATMSSQTPTVSDSSSPVASPVMPSGGSSLTPSPFSNQSASATLSQNTGSPTATASDSSPNPLSITGSSPTPTATPDDGGSACFPAHAVVSLEDGRLTRIDSLRIGDTVHVGAGEVSRVIAFTHADHSVVSNFVNFTTANGRHTSVSPGHYMYTSRGLITGEKIAVGDSLELASGLKTRVIRKQLVRSTGLFNPHTVHGDIVVDGYRASTYTSAVEPMAAHTLLTPIRLLDVVGVKSSLVSFLSSRPQVVALVRRMSEV